MKRPYDKPEIFLTEAETDYHLLEGSSTLEVSNEPANKNYEVLSNHSMWEETEE